MWVCHGLSRNGGRIQNQAVWMGQMGDSYDDKFGGTIFSDQCPACSWTAKSNCSSSQAKKIEVVLIEMKALQLYMKCWRTIGTAFSLRPSSMSSWSMAKRLLRAAHLAVGLAFWRHSKDPVGGLLKSFKIIYFTHRKHDLQGLLNLENLGHPIFWTFFWTCVYLPPQDAVLVACVAFQEVLKCLGQWSYCHLCLCMCLKLSEMEDWPLK